MNRSNGRRKPALRGRRFVPWAGRREITVQVFMSRTQREREATTMIRINDTKWKTTLKAAVLASACLLSAAVTGFGQQQVNLTAGANTTTMPDGAVVPMWGYTCGTP